MACYFPSGKGDGKGCFFPSHPAFASANSLLALGKGTVVVIGIAGNGKKNAIKSSVAKQLLLKLFFLV
jgi:hypothetical protein